MYIFAIIIGTNLSTSTSRARLPKKLTFEPGDYVLNSSRRNIILYLVHVRIVHTDSAARAVQSTRRLASLLLQADKSVASYKYNEKHLKASA